MAGVDGPLSARSDGERDEENFKTTAKGKTFLNGIPATYMSVLMKIGE
jgi:hypothetical protein